MTHPTAAVLQQQQAEGRHHPRDRQLQKRPDCTAMRRQRGSSRRLQQPAAAEAMASTWLRLHLTH